MEEHGVPSAVIVTYPFISSSKAMAVAHGMPDYPFAAIPHPIAATERDILNEWADRITHEIEEILLKG
jgi:hypothetical protein